MKECEICKTHHNKKRFCSLECRNIGNSIFNKSYGIVPPSRKGVMWTSEAIAKRTVSRQRNGWNRDDPLTKRRQSISRIKLFDVIGRSSTFMTLLKRSRKYEKWRIAVFERDDYTCQDCGVRGGKLEADHIRPKSNIVNECDRDLKKCLKYKQLWDLSNGRTLCNPCHKQTPTYGIKALKWNNFQMNGGNITT